MGVWAAKKSGPIRPRATQKITAGCFPTLFQVGFRGRGGDAGRPGKGACPRMGWDGWFGQWEGGAGRAGWRGTAWCPTIPGVLRGQRATHQQGQRASKGTSVLQRCETSGSMSPHAARRACRFARLSVWPASASPNWSRMTAMKRLSTTTAPTTLKLMKRSHACG